MSWKLDTLTLHALLVAMATSLTAGASKADEPAGTSATAQLSATPRLVYLNGKLAGAYTVCSDADLRQVYFARQFFDEIRLKRREAEVWCDGEAFFAAPVEFARYDALGSLSATPGPQDFDGGGPSPVPAARPARPAPDGVDATLLRQAAQVWLGPSDPVVSLGWSALHYTSASGMFSFEGTSSYDGGELHSYISDLGWRRHFADAQVNARFGLQSLWLAGSASRVLGLTVESDSAARAASTVGRLEGFAEVPGRLQIRSHGTLLKEVPVAAGYFSVPLPGWGLPASGQYTLTLLGADDQVLRTWNEFVPAGTQLLLPGRWTYQVFAGHLQDESAQFSPTVTGPRNLGAGFSIRRGLTAQLSGELAATLAEHSGRAGLALDYVPADWLDFNLGANRFRGEHAPYNAYANLGLHLAGVDASAGIVRQDCDSRIQGASACKTLRLSAAVPLGPAGRLTLLRTVYDGGYGPGFSNGFSWAPPVWRGMSLSLYGARQRQAGVASTQVGLQLQMPLGGGNLFNAVSHTSSGGTSATSAFSKVVSPELNYSVGVDAGEAQPGALRGAVSFNPWYGRFSGNAHLSQGGRLSLGVGEETVHVIHEGRLLTSRHLDSAVAIVCAADLPGQRLAYPDGRTAAMLDPSGCAAVPVSAAGGGEVHVPPEDLPDDLQVSDPVIGAGIDDWTATAWRPSVRHVHRGWMRLIFEAGPAVPMGSQLELGDGSYADVLEDGQVYVEDLPPLPLQLLVRTPGNSHRCVARLPQGMRLAGSFAADLPSLVCHLPGMAPASAPVSAPVSAMSDTATDPP